MTLSGAAARRRTLLEWYEGRRFAYPWRRTRDPYGVFVSEVMLQQTQVARVVPVFERFVAAFPGLEALASAPRSAVVRAWGGLGHNRRAVSLSLAARAMIERHGGVVPHDPEVLRSLPGVGPYTAAAVASIAFEVPVAAIDTNVRRVVGRTLAGRDDADRSIVDDLAAAWLDPARPGDWNQAAMDLGRAFCRPRPACEPCPLRAACRFRATGATVRSAGRAQPPFVGSPRHVRGDVVRILRSTGSASVATLVAQTGHPRERVDRAVASLVADGIVHAGAAAAAGSPPRGRVRLAT